MADKLAEDSDEKKRMKAKKASEHCTVVIKLRVIIIIKFYLDIHRYSMGSCALFDL